MVTQSQDDTPHNCLSNIKDMLASGLSTLVNVQSIMHTRADPTLIEAICHLDECNVSELQCNRRQNSYLLARIII